MSLCIGISDNIEDATITIDEATILEIKAMIALPFQLRLTSFVEQRRQRNSQKVCCTFRIFFFSYFLVSIFVVVAQTELASSVTPRKACNYWYATISPEKPTIWWKTRHGIDVRGYPHRSSDVRVIFCSFPEPSWENGFPVSYSFLMLNKETIY